jgi:hypothetical protein
VIYMLLGATCLLLIGAQLELLFDLWRVDWRGLKRFDGASSLSTAYIEWKDASLSFGRESFDGVVVSTSADCLSVAVRRTYLRPLSWLLAPIHIPKDVVDTKIANRSQSFYIGKPRDVHSIRRLFRGVDRRVHRIDVDVHDRSLPESL